ncbi:MULTISPECIES: hypothetical protein [Arthrobacter]|uniref:Uncharacterized protein n=2 Tax=Arthrobacter TaxID=1663 RepID=A0ABU9KLP0_9MICC|nr:hypothetical protein [Arthrobacter sp. YJM1]MDP5228450.1 hypothetical protein [Arthrobacter sp. YJM1]
MPGIQPGDEDRVHSEAPAEGEEVDEPDVIRAHSEDPAEGPDED